MKVEKAIDIAASPEDVYAVVMDPDRLGDWVLIHERLVDGPGRELERGDELEQQLKVAGQRFRVRWTVTRADRPRQVEWEGVGPMRTKARVAYGLEPSGGGTRFSYLNEYELPGGAAGRLAGRAISAAAGRESQRTLDRLKGLLESG
jgi:carbon monoxide dehydrogenase subunit G